MLKLTNDYLDSIIKFRSKFVIRKSTKHMLQFAIIIHIQKHVSPMNEKTKNNVLRNELENNIA